MVRKMRSLLAFLAQNGDGFEPFTDTVLWVIAVILVLAGIIALLVRRITVGIVLIVIGLLVGPGGVSLLD